MIRRKTAAYQMVSERAGRRCRFFCDRSGALVYTSDPLPTDDREDSLMWAWYGGGRKHFNLCPSCGRWVSDPMYNADTLECVACSPWEAQPIFCPHCGEKVAQSDVFCPHCRKRLRYGKEVKEHETNG